MYGNTGQYGKGAYLRDSVSPPLHHPVPQHPIPPMRSPSNLEESFNPPKHRHTSSNAYIPQQLHQQAQNPAPSSNTARAAFDSVGSTTDYSQPHGQSAEGSFGQYGNFFADPTAQIGINVGRNALSYGQDYVTRHVCYNSSHLKEIFANNFRYLKICMCLH